MKCDHRVRQHQLSHTHICDRSASVEGTNTTLVGVEGNIFKDVVVGVDFEDMGTQCVDHRARRCQLSHDHICDRSIVTEDTYTTLGGVDDNIFEDVTVAADFKDMGTKHVGALPDCQLQLLRPFRRLLRVLPHHVEV